jgi:hypothetical protein
VISKELLSELKIILKEEYSVELTDGEVEELGNCLVSCFQILSENTET